MIIGVYGKIGSGKSFAASYICKKYKYKEYSLGDEVRIQAKKDKVEPNRKNLSKISSTYRKKYGEDYWVKRLVKKIKSKKILISGIRSYTDYLYLKKIYPKLFLIEIYSTDNIRFNRLLNRNRIGDPKNKFEFIKQNLTEYVNFSGVYKLEKNVDIKIENNEKPDKLYKNIDKIINQKSLY